MCGYSMSRYIHRIIKKVEHTTADNQTITLYYYDIGHGDTVKTPQVFQVGEQVEAWFSSEWNEIRIRKSRHIVKEKHSEWNKSRGKTNRPQE